MKNERKDLIVRDWLAIERTHLSNERTFLAYFRSSLVFASSGLAVLQLEFLKEIWYLGIILLCLAPALFIVAIIKYRYTRRKIRSYYIKKEGE